MPVRSSSCLNMFRHLKGLPSFSRSISKGALEGSSNTNLRPPAVSTSLPTNFHAFSISFRKSDGPSKITTSLSVLIQISSLRRNNNVFSSVIYKEFDLESCYSTHRVLPFLRGSPSTVTTQTSQSRRAPPSHQTQNPFYITSHRRKNPVSRENYASELYRVMILRLSRVGLTSCYEMVGYGCVPFIFFQKFIFLCMKN